MKFSWRVEAGFMVNYSKLELFGLTVLIVVTYSSMCGAKRDVTSINKELFT